MHLTTTEIGALPAVWAIFRRYEMVNRLVDVPMLLMISKFLKVTISLIN